MAESETPQSLHLLAEDSVLIDAVRFSFLYQKMQVGNTTIDDSGLT